MLALSCVFMVCALFCALAFEKVAAVVFLALMMICIFVADAGFIFPIKRKRGNK